MNMQNLNSPLVAIACTVIILIGVAIGVWASYPDPSLGSVEVSSEYTATSTAANAVFGALTGDVVIKRGQATIGSVIITGANTGIFNIYDATTTNIALRAAVKATSTILIASFPASATAGTYTIDAFVKDGILLDLDSGSMPTTTVTFR